LEGNLRRSIQLNVPGLTLILPKFHNTLVLTVGALAITVPWVTHQLTIA
jgi:hypothetical protein